MGLPSSPESPEKSQSDLRSWIACHLRHVLRIETNVTVHTGKHFVGQSRVVQIWSLGEEQVWMDGEERHLTCVQAEACSGWTVIVCHDKQAVVVVDVVLESKSLAVIADGQSLFDRQVVLEVIQVVLRQKRDAWRVACTAQVLGPVLCSSQHVLAVTGPIACTRAPT